MWAALALVAAVPWFGLVAHDERLEDPVRDVSFGDVARTRMGWAMAGFFGLQSLNAYVVFGWFATMWRDADFGAGTASALVGIVASLSIPLSLWAPQAVARPGDQRWVLVLVMGCYPVAYVGLLLAPHSLAVLWAVVLGVALVTFPIVLTLIGLRTRTAGATAALSGFTQSTGYLMAAVGPFGIGVLHEATDGWTVPLLALTALSVPLFLLGLYVGRPAHLEDQLAARQPDVESYR
jgi:CP family cyanate transporter-like MFS transporter